MRTGALARQNMFLGGMTQSQIGDMVKQYQANQPSATSATPPVAPVAPPPPNLYANKPVTPPPAEKLIPQPDDLPDIIDDSGLIPVIDDTTGMPKIPTDITKTAADFAPDSLGAYGGETGGEERQVTLAADKYLNAITANPTAFGYTSFEDAQAQLAAKYGAGNITSGLRKEIYDNATFSYSTREGEDTPYATGVSLGGKNIVQLGDDGKVVGDLNYNRDTGEGFEDFDAEDFQKTFSGAGVGQTEQLDKNPKWVEINRVDNGDGTDTVYFQDQNPNSPSYNKIITQIRKRGDGGDSDGSSGGGTGGGTGTGAGGLEGRFGDVLNQFDQMAGLTGTMPDLPGTAKVNPTDMQVQTGELETTAGVQLGATQQAPTSIVSNEQIEALQAAGYTLKSNADTVAGTTETINNVTAQALNAQTLSTLTDSVDEVTGKRIVGESIIGSAPSRESIDQKKATGLAVTDMNGADRSKTPTVGDVTGNFNDKINAASRSITTNEIVQPIDPATANQGTAQVMAELRDNATMVAAQSSTDEQTRATAQAITQQMSEVPVEATVQGQLTNLMAQFADGKTPAYAAGAIRNAEAQMAARGLSASSMAGGAIMQAAMESSLPIAAQDAQVFREINLSNINNKQKVALANQAAALQIGLADLTNRQQEALSNSTNGFKLQSQSLSNMQQASLANAQLRASLQERELGFEQQRQLVNAARYAEIEGINLNNEQQGIMQDSVNNMQVSMSNMSFKQQRELSKAQIDAALTGQELNNDQQAAVVNAARVAEVNNLTFNEEQQRNLNNSQLMQNMTLANLDADMRAALSDAATYASMETANLNNRQQAQVVNAQAFLNMDMANLTNNQQGEVLKYQARTNALFTDAAADNARQQFNATSENQVDEFFAQLGASVAQQNANRVASMKEFNVDQTNAHSRFNASLVDNREKFNSTMQAQINQSNAAWRRQINTVNTATQNEANRQNALNVLGINQNALNNLWQTYRDEAGWLFTEGMTDKQYAHEIAKMNLNAAQQRALYNLQVKGDTVESIGAVVVDAALKI